MWIFAKTGFISVVVHRADPALLMVRARFEGDIEAVFGDLIDVRVTPFADYRFRTQVGRKRFAKVLARMVDEMDYDNFKNSVARSDPERVSDYMSVWAAMESAQERRIRGEKMDEESDEASEDFLRRMGWTI